MEQARDAFKFWCQSVRDAGHERPAKWQTEVISAVVESGGKGRVLLPLRSGKSWSAQAVMQSHLGALDADAFGGNWHGVGKLLMATRPQGRATRVSIVGTKGIRSVIDEYTDPFRVRRVASTVRHRIRPQDPIPRRPEEIVGKLLCAVLFPRPRPFDKESLQAGQNVEGRGPLTCVSL